MAAEGLEQAVLCADQVNLFMKTVYKCVNKYMVVKMEIKLCLKIVNIDNM